MERGAVSLDIAEEGRRYTILLVDAGRGLTEKIMEMGLIPGTEILVLRASRGHVIVSVRGSQIALSRGIAKKILVRPV